MSVDAVLPIVLAVGWLVVAGAALASYRLRWSQAIKMALVWIAISGGLYLVVEWFLTAQATASALDLDFT